MFQADLQLPKSNKRTRLMVLAQGKDLGCFSFPV